MSGPTLSRAVVASVALALLTWTLGQWRHSQRSYVVTSLLERAHRAEHEQEQQAWPSPATQRANLARDLHVVAHSLAVMTAQAD